MGGGNSNIENFGSNDTTVKAPSNLSSPNEGNLESRLFDLQKGLGSIGSSLTFFEVGVSEKCNFDCHMELDLSQPNMESLSRNGRLAKSKNSSVNNEKSVSLRPRGIA